MRMGRQLILGVMALSLSVSGLFGQRSQDGNRIENDRVSRSSGLNGPALNMETRDGKAQPRKPDSMELSSNKVIGELEKNPRALKGVERILPIDMTLAEASDGFKDRSQFIAALHASKNLNIPFSDFKVRMTGDHPLKLERVIHELKPQLSRDQVDAETKKAEKQAKDTEQTG